MNAGIETVKMTEETLDHANQQIDAIPTKNTLYSTTLSPPITNFVNRKNEQTSNSFLQANESDVSNACVFSAQYDDVTGNASQRT